MVGVVALVVILVFILQNLQSFELHFLAWHGQLPSGMALLFAAILGTIAVLAFGGAGNFSCDWLPGEHGSKELTQVHLRRANSWLKDFFAVAHAGVVLH